MTNQLESTIAIATLTSVDAAASGTFRYFGTCHATSNPHNKIIANEIARQDRYLKLVFQHGPIGLVRAVTFQSKYYSYLPKQFAAFSKWHSTECDRPKPLGTLAAI